MIWLVLFILASALLFIIFKLFEKFGIDNLQAIVVNYIVAGTLGFALASTDGQSFSLNDILHSKWIGYAVALGFLFISVFNLMAISSQKSGISATSVANKMSVVIPVLFGLMFMQESAGLWKIIGVVLALIAVYLTSKTENISSGKNLLFPLLIFFGSGVLDTLLGYVNTLIQKNEQVTFTATLFSVAALMGIISLMVLIVAGKKKLEFKNLIAGICLGIPNFGSIYFLFKGLDASGMESSAFFPVVNMGVVATSTLLGFIMFREKISFINLTGIILALAAIALISLK